MAVLGITGGIATGKSTLTGWLQRHFPAVYFDSDATARRLLEGDGEVLAEVRTAFGAAVFTEGDAIDRGRLREAVFGDPEAKKTLEAILHPRIRREWVTQAEGFKGRREWLVVDIPLLYEVGVERYFDRVVVVACGAETQRRRVISGRGLSPGMADRIIASQQSLESKISRADHVIWSDAPEATLALQAALLAQYLESDGGNCTETNLMRIDYGREP